MPILTGTATAGEVVAAVEAFRGTSLVWTDHTGASWDFSDPSGGVVALNSGITGLGMPTITRYTSVAPAVAGSRWKGWRVEEREVMLPLLVWSDVSDAQFLARDRALWAGMRPDAPGTLTFTTPDGQSRVLTCRFSSDNGDTTYYSPTRSGWHEYQVSLVADDDPLWRGPAERWTFAAGTASPWFSGAGGVITISPSQTLGNAQVTNRGEVDAWPVWSVTGPVDTLVLGVGGGTVSIASAIAAGQSVDIDTRPSSLSIVDQSGADLSGVAEWRALPCPPGDPVELSITAAGTSAATRITMSLTPGYFRAW